MESKHITFSLSIIFLHFLTFSNSEWIVKNLPGFDGDLPFTLETGYVGVGEDEEVQVFYYFVESERNPSDDPVLLYLTGGPGTSGLYPLLYQIGPLSFNFESSWKNNITLELNPNSWSKVANVIFVDLPVGVGFSCAKTWEASRSGDSLLALQSYEFLRKWLVENPRFVSNPLYISGISYMGIIVPNVALKVYKGNERGNQPQLNIKGCLIVSPLTHRFIDFNSRIEYAHRVALISDDIYEATKETCHGKYVYNDPENTLCLKNLQRVDEEATNIFIDDWENNKDVQKALNVGEGIFSNFTYLLFLISYDICSKSILVKICDY